MAGWQDEVARIRVMAPPEGGRANRELIDWLARRLDIPRRAVQIQSGDTARTKTVRLMGVSPNAIKDALEEHNP